MIFFRFVREDSRNQRLTASIYTLANAQMESDALLKEQCNILQKRNSILEQELKDSRKETKKAMIIITSTAFASFVATILIGIFSII